MNSVRVFLDYTIHCAPLHDAVSFCEERFGANSYRWEGVKNERDTVNFIFKNSEDALMFKLMMSSTNEGSI